MFIKCYLSLPKPKMISGFVEKKKRKNNKTNFFTKLLFLFSSYKIEIKCLFVLLVLIYSYMLVVEIRSKLATV